MASLVFGVLADYASADNQQKLSINGIFQKIHAASLPARHLRAYLVARIAFTAEEIAGRKEIPIEIEIVDPDGQPVTDEAKTVLVRIGPEDQIEPGVHYCGILGAINELVLKRYGPHSVKISADGAEVGRVSFLVDRERSPAA